MVVLRAFTSGLNVSCAIRKVPVNRLSDVELRELLARWRKLALRSTGDEFLLFGLRLAPVASFERLPEALAVNVEMCVPRLTAFYESHSSHLSFETLLALLLSIWPRDELRGEQSSNSLGPGASEQMVRCNADKCEVPSLQLRPVEHEHRKRSSCHRTKWPE